MRWLALAGVALAVGGCGGGVRDAVKGVSGDGGESVVRAWTSEVYAGEYDRAASLFAIGAIVQQSQTVVLSSHELARAFNASLPCRAKVTAIQREPGGTLLASFKLFPGPIGGCPHGGDARVRFRIRAGRIELWRQLPEAPTPPGQST